MTSGGPGRNWPSGSMRWRRAFSRSGWSAARDRHLVAEPAGMDADAICRRQGRPHSGHHQSRLSPERTRIRAGQGRLRRDRHRDRVQDHQLHGDAEHAAAGAGDVAARRTAGGAAAATARGDPDRRPGRPGTIAFEDGGQHGRRAAPRRARRTRPRRCSSTMPSISSSPAAPPARPKGVTLTHHNILNNGYFVGRAMRLTETRPHLHSGAALSLLRHGDGQSRLPSRTARRWSIPARASIRWRRCRPSSRRNARRSTACRPCSSPNSTIRSSRTSTCRRCAPASWPARPARSR